MANDERPSDAAVLNTQSGFSLVEMVVAILLTAVIVTGTFSALLLTKANLGNSDNQMSINFVQRQLLETLKNYQSASIAGPNNVDYNSGPNQRGSCGSTWCLTPPGESGTACSGANCPASCASGACQANSYALQTGCGHNVTKWLPQAIQGAPYNGVMCYTVTDTSGLNSADQSQFRPQVNVTVQWTEPQP